MGHDYVPPNDNEFKLWLANFVSILTVNASVVGLVPADLTPITAESDEFASALEGYQQQLSLTASASSNKKTRRTTAEGTLRPLVRRINNHPGMTDQLRSLLGLKPMGMAMDAIPIEELIPGIQLESAVGMVTVHWGPNPMNERMNGKPEGVKGANVYRKKAGEADYRILGYASASPYYDEISGDAADYVYYVRYRGTKASWLSKPSAMTKIAARGVEEAA